VTYRLPPLNGLRAFEAAARHMSFKYAADELCVTAGAVSQHVKALETALGIKLFRRSARAIALTAEGREYLPSIRTAFEVIAKASDEACAGLHIDRIVVRAGESGRMPAILVTRPGIAGCRQHRTLVKLLRA
jgi:LysR family glycine cleavage system transcriptional activator